jgi:hypothetical protein
VRDITSKRHVDGSTYAELTPRFEADSETKGIAIHSEPGGRMETELADWVRENKSRLPIVVFMAGRFMDEMPDMRFGHAGTIVEGKGDTTTENWGRDTFIALRGPRLATGRSEAFETLREWAAAVSEGVLPNRFPFRQVSTRRTWRAATRRSVSMRPGQGTWSGRRSRVPGTLHESESA